MTQKNIFKYNQAYFKYLHVMNYDMQSIIFISFWHTNHVNK